MKLDKTGKIMLAIMIVSIIGIISILGFGYKFDVVEAAYDVKYLIDDIKYDIKHNEAIKKSEEKRKQEIIASRHGYIHTLSDIWYDGHRYNGIWYDDIVHHVENEYIYDNHNNKLVPAGNPIKLSILRVYSKDIEAGYRSRFMSLITPYKSKYNYDLRTTGIWIDKNLIRMQDKVPYDGLNLEERDKLANYILELYNSKQNKALLGIQIKNGMAYFDRSEVYNRYMAYHYNFPELSLTHFFKLEPSSDTYWAFTLNEDGSLLGMVRYNQYDLDNTVIECDTHEIMDKIVELAPKSSKEVPITLNEDGQLVLDKEVFGLNIVDDTSTVGGHSYYKYISKDSEWLDCIYPGNSERTTISMDEYRDILVRIHRYNYKPRDFENMLEDFY